jgi:hypothetical protein
MLPVDTKVCETAVKVTDSNESSSTNVRDTATEKGEFIFDPFKGVHIEIVSLVKV